MLWAVHHWTGEPPAMANSVVRERVGHELETEPRRLERVREVVSSVERRVRPRARRTIGTAQAFVSASRADDVDPDR